MSVKDAMDLQVLIAGRWGGEVLNANTDFATGGPVHPEILGQANDVRAKAQMENKKPPEGLPDPTWRDDAEDGHRCIGDLIRVPRARGLGLIRNHVLGVPDDIAVAKRAEARAFIEAVIDGDDDAKPPTKPRTRATSNDEEGEPEAAVDG